MTAPTARAFMAGPETTAAYRAAQDAARAAFEAGISVRFAAADATAVEPYVDAAEIADRAAALETMKAAHADARDAYLAAFDAWQALVRDGATR